MDKIAELINNIPFVRYMPQVDIFDAIEIIILTIIVYYTVKNLKNTRAWALLKGVITILAVYLAAYIANFSVITILFQNLLLFLGIAIIVIIQPELRKLIESIGTKDINISLKNIASLIFKDRKPKDTVQRLSDFSIQEIVRGCSLMSKAKTGALIVIECNTPLNEYIESGIKVNADITSQLFINVFEKNTPLHDGAVIIQNNKLSAATCYLPLSDSKNINKDLGTRHRAGIGISEVTDSLTIIVSEETGAISVAHGGKLLHNIDREKLAEELKKIQNVKVKNTEKKISKRESIFTPTTSLKTECLVASLILWLIVISANNPIDTRTIHDIPIEVINYEMLEDTGKTYDIVGGYTVDVKIRDTKQIVDRITANDIKAVVDLSKLSYTNAVPVEVTIEKYPSTDITVDKPMINISLEDIITTEVDIAVNMVGEDNKDYYISNVDLDYTTIMISGAKSIINTIGEVTVDLDKTNITSNTTVELIPKVYDKNGDLMDTDKLNLNHEKVKATVSLYKTKMISLNIKPDITNSVLEQVINYIDYDYKSIYVTGPDEVLSKYSSIDIELPLDISLGEIAKYQYSRIIDLSEYIPSELIIVPGYEKVTLTVFFLDFYNKSISFNSSQLSIEGLSSDLKTTIEPKDIIIAIVDKSNTVESLDVTSIVPYIDLSGLAEGTHETTVKFKNYADNIFGDTRVTVTIQKIEV